MIRLWIVEIIQYWCTLMYTDVYSISSISLWASFSIFPHLLAAPLLHAVRSPTSPTSASPVTLRPAKPVEPVKPVKPVKPIPQKLAVAMQNPPVSESLSPPRHWPGLQTWGQMSQRGQGRSHPGTGSTFSPSMGIHQYHSIPIVSYCILLCHISILEEHPSTSWDSPGNQGFHPRVRNGRACVQPQIHPYTAQRAFRIIQDHSGIIIYHLATLVHTPFAENTLVVADWTRGDRSETKYLTCTPR